METRWTTSVKLIVVVCLLVVGAWLLVRFSQVIPFLLVTVILAYLLKPPTDWLVRRTGWPRGLAILVLFLILLAVIVLGPVLATPSVATIFASIKIDPAAWEPLFERLNGATLVLGPITIDGSDLSQQALAALQALVTPFASGALQILAGVASSLFWIVFVVVAAFWLVKDSNRLEAWVLDHIPGGHRAEIRRLLTEIGVIWGGFFRGEILLALIVGTLVGVSMWILGLPNVLLLALISGLMEFIPTLGPTLAAIPGMLVAVVLGSSWLAINPWLLALIVGAVYFLIFQFEQVYLLPRIVGGRVNLHPGIVFVATIIGATQIGLLGVLIAAPVIATARLIGGYVYRKLLDLDPGPTWGAAAAGSGSAATERGVIRGQPIAAILFDLDGTLGDTDDDMVRRLSQRLGLLARFFPKRDPSPFVRHLLLLAESPINWLISQFDRLDLDDDAFRASVWLSGALGYRKVEQISLVPGVVTALRTLRPGYKLALVTTRSRHSTAHFVRMHQLERFFDVIVTRDDVRRLKPHPEPLLLAARSLQVQPEHCVMVGDTTADLLAAQAAGMRAIGVLCGFGARRELNDADVVLASTAELTTCL